MVVWRCASLMDIALIPETYVPAFDGTGYTDSLPLGQCQAGFRCPCNDKRRVYSSLAAMRTHIKGKKHKEWVRRLSADRANHYRELLRAKETIRQQTIQLAQYDRRDTARELLIARLEKENQQLRIKREVPVADLLELDFQ